MNQIAKSLFVCLCLFGCASSTPVGSSAPYYRDTLTGPALTRAAAREFLPRCNTPFPPARAHQVEVTFRGTGAAFYRVMVGTEERGSTFGRSHCYIEVADGEEVNVQLGVNQTPQTMSVLPIHDVNQTGHFTLSYDEILNPLRVMRDGYEQIVTRACWQSEIGVKICEFRFPPAVND